MCICVHKKKGNAVKLIYMHIHLQSMFLGGGGGGTICMFKSQITIRSLHTV